MKKKFLKTFIAALAVITSPIISPSITAKAVDPTVTYQSLTDQTSSTTG